MSQLRSPATERSLFEAWLEATFDSGAEFDDARNCYKEPSVHLGWQAWRGARSLPASRSETPKQMPCIEIGAYTVGPRRDGSFWIEHESGEGMQIRAEILAGAIHAFYKEHF